MLHIRYMSDNKTICEKPTRLDTGDFVVQDTSVNPEPSCRECSDLLLAHNKREFEREYFERPRIIMPQREIARYYDDGTGLDKFIGGLALATGFWVTFFVILWAVWLR